MKYSTCKYWAWETTKQVKDSKVLRILSFLIAYPSVADGGLLIHKERESVIA
jgi:hypothetical protein